MNSKEKDTQSRKWLLTINNPLEKGLTHDAIENLISNLTSAVYYCMSDEKGLEEETFHTHIYIVFSSPVRFSTLKNLLPSAHLDVAKGNSVQVRDYILKSAKWSDTDKKETSIEGSFKEVGEMPIERQGKRTDMQTLYDLLLEGKSDIELIEANQNNIRYLSYADRVRQTLVWEKVKNIYRDVRVTYIFGKTNTHKTRYVMEYKHHYNDIFRISAYNGHIWDNYKAESSILLDEFNSVNSRISITEMLTLLDGYPRELFSRYSNKWAAWTNVYIVSNIPLEKQYEDVREENIDVYRAWRRRIHNVYEFIGNGEYIDCANPNVRHKIDELLE